MFTLKCVCGAQFPAAEELAGRTVACPMCGALQPVPPKAAAGFGPPPQYGPPPAPGGSVPPPAYGGFAAAPPGAGFGPPPAGMTPGYPPPGYPPPTYPPGGFQPGGCGPGGFAPVGGVRYSTAERRQSASWGLRFMAMLLDGMIIGLPMLVLYIALIAVVVSASGPGGQSGGTAEIGAVVFMVLMMAAAIAGVLYPPIMMARTNGQTLGKKWMGIRVVRDGGEPVTFGWAFLREFVVKNFLVNAVAQFTCCIGLVLNFLWPLWDDEGRCVHDMIVQSHVVPDRQ